MRQTSEPGTRGAVLTARTAGTTAHISGMAAHISGIRAHIQHRSPGKARNEIMSMMMNLLSGLTDVGTLFTLKATSVASLRRPAHITVIRCPHHRNTHVPSFAAKLVSGVDLAPFWTLAVIHVYRKQKRIAVTAEASRGQSHEQADPRS